MKKLWIAQYDGAERLCFEKDDFADTCRRAKPEDETIEALAQMMDHDAENKNRHAVVGTHERLAALLLVECKPDAAQRVMRKLADLGGLHGINS